MGHPEHTAEYKLEKKAVNSKTLFEEIHKYIDEGITNAGVLWSSDSHRQSFIEVVGDFLEQLTSENKIEQWNVICDLRNNTISAMDKGEYILEVTFKQKNCLNTTRLIYSIKDILIAQIKEALDFTLTP